MPRAEAWPQDALCATPGRMSEGHAILIAGPTAGGKSGLALRLAERLGGIIINANSMQVYRELRHPHRAPEPRGGGPHPARALWFRRGR